MDKITAQNLIRKTDPKGRGGEGGETILRAETPAAPHADALMRLRHGYHLGDQPLTREQAHAR